VDNGIDLSQGGAPALVMNIGQIAFDEVEGGARGNAGQHSGGVVGWRRTEIQPNQSFDARQTGQVAKEFGRQVAQPAGDGNAADWVWCVCHGAACFL
jgi:hypothetical protein